jgi:hypothetical protein
LWKFGLKAYVPLVEEYTKRELTYDSDIPNAFSGISEVLTNACGGGDVYGLPKAVFHLGLLWYPSQPTTQR